MRTEGGPDSSSSLREEAGRPLRLTNPSARSRLRRPLLLHCLNRRYKFMHHSYVSNNLLMYPKRWVGPAAWEEGSKRGRYRASTVLPTASSHPILARRFP
jgi:hypothetical protein